MRKDWFLCYHFLLAYYAAMQYSVFKREVSMKLLNELFLQVFGLFIGVMPKAVRTKLYNKLDDAFFAYRGRYE